MDERLTPEEQRQVSQAFEDFGTPDIPAIPPITTPKSTEQPIAEIPSKPQRKFPWLPAAIFFALCICAAIVIACLPKDKEQPFNPYSPSNYRQTMDVGIAVTADGKVVCDTLAYQNNLNAWSDVIAVSASNANLFALKSDGTVLVQSGIIQLRNTIAEWRDIVAIDASGTYLAALRSDGTVVVASYYPELDYGATKTEDWADIVAISAGLYHVVGLKADGTVVSTQIKCPSESSDPFDAFLLSLDRGQTDVSDWTDIVAISAGPQHTIGLRSDGTVVAVGDNTTGQCEVSEWQNIAAVSAGDRHTLGLRSDGTVVAAGDSILNSACDVSYFSDVVAIAAGSNKSYVLTRDGTVFTTVDQGFSGTKYVYAAAFVNIRSPFLKEKSSGS